MSLRKLLIESDYSDLKGDIIEWLNREHSTILDNWAFTEHSLWEDYVEEYFETLQDLQNNGGEIVRFLFIPKDGEIDKEKLGSNWTVYDDNLFPDNLNGDWSDGYRLGFIFESLHDNYIQRNDGTEQIPPIKLYAVICTIPPNSIDFKESWREFYDYPEEKEVNLNNNTRPKIKEIKLISNDAI